MSDSWSKPMLGSILYMCKDSGKSARMHRRATEPSLFADAISTIIPCAGLDNARVS